MAFLSKYGVARHIYVPVIKRAVVDFAVSADWTPAAGDVKISKDGGAAANVTNLPTAITMGNAAMWDFSITATEMQAAQILITVADAATKAVEDTMFVIETYGNASAEHPFDLASATVTVGTNNDKTGYSLSQSFPSNFSSLSIDGSGRVDLGKWIGNAPNALQSGRVDSYIGAIANAVIAAASFAANALDAVWSTTTRTLSAFGFNVTVGTNNDKTGYALTSGEETAIADALLARDIGSGSNAGSLNERTVRAALRLLRNKWSVIGTTLTATKEDDVTTAWTATTHTTAGDPIDSVDPT